MEEAKTTSIDERAAARNTATAIFSAATKQNLPFAVYRMPESLGFRIIVGSELKEIDEDFLASNKPGFLIAGYEGSHYFIDQAITFNSEVGDINSHHSILDLEDIKHHDPKVRWIPYTLPNDDQDTDREDYINYVNLCKKTIAKSDLIKAVPSRIKRISLPETFDLLTLFENLCTTYPSAFVSITSSKELGTWIGATPESLVEVNATGIFRTMSLAGTQPYDGKAELHTLLWTQKEIEEQAMVSRYIINRLKEIRLREFIETGPRTVEAGNMAHLCSTFTVDTVATNFPNLGSTMLKLLHPTSAVCGMPKQLAKPLIASAEKHDRRLYSGYLGPVNKDFGSYVFVNLRCMEYQGNEGILYAGAGVTQYSIAEEEWQETDLKCNTILDLIES